jgi:hypothetical protein
MEPSPWTRFIAFIKDSYTARIKHAFSGVLMGFIAGQHLLFAGALADLVTAGWWIFKGISTVVLAFFTSLATSYAAYLIDKHKNKNNESRKRPRKKAA